MLVGQTAPLHDSYVSLVLYYVKGLPTQSIKTTRLMVHKLSLQIIQASHPIKFTRTHVQQVFSNLVAS